MVGKDGKQYENRIVNEINVSTKPNVVAMPCGYSGNHNGANPDFIVLTRDQNWAVELKKTAREKFTVQTDDLEQIRACANIHTRPCIALKYSHRELMVTEFGMNGGEVADTPSAFNPRYGRTGTFITDKPSLDEWPSSRSGRSDTDVLLDACGITEVGVEDESFDLNQSEAEA